MTRALDALLKEGAIEATGEVIGAAAVTTALLLVLNGIDLVAMVSSYLVGGTRLLSGGLLNYLWYYDNDEVRQTLSALLPALVAGLVMTFIRRQLRERDLREVLLASELFDAERAREIGLINRVVPSGDEGVMLELTMLDFRICWAGKVERNVVPNGRASNRVKF